MSDKHSRMCWSCRSIALHAADHGEEVRCKSCGSWDTRRRKPATEQPPQVSEVERLREEILELRGDISLLMDVLNGLLNKNDTLARCVPTLEAAAMQAREIASDINQRLHVRDATTGTRTDANSVALGRARARTDKNGT